MKKFNIDWSYMKPALVVLGIGLVVSVSHLIASNLYLSSAEERHTTYNNLRLDTEEDGRRVENDVLLAQVYTAPFSDLLENGFIGSEQRLNWIETLRGVADEIKLNRTGYRIEPKEAVRLEYIENSGGYDVYASKMNIQLDLLHEGDLLSVIDSMSARASGIFHTESCNLNRLNDQFVPDSVGPNIRAECTFVWYTMDTGRPEFEEEYE